MERFRLQDGVGYAQYHNIPDVWPTEDTRAIPFVVACVAFGLQLLHLIASGIKSYVKTTDATKESLESESEVELGAGRKGLTQRAQDYARQRGGYTILGFTIARLAGCIALLVLSVVGVRKCQARPTSGPSAVLAFFTECPESFMVATYSYTIALTLISLVSKRWRVSVTRYNIVILLAALGVYIYRDLWPLATYTQHPEDLSDGKLLWAKVAVLIFTASIIPLVIPRQYRPIDPKNPMAVTNSEQTASLISLMTYVFLDDIILKGYRVSHLETNDLPPLADYDNAEHLKEKGFRHLDVFSGAKRRHMFFNLMRVYRKEYTIMAAMVFLQSLGNFASPIGINRILAYLETGGNEAYIRPWFWIIWLFIGPMLCTLAFQWYIFIATRTLARTEGLLTELIFEHSLRIRMKAEPSDDQPKASSPETAPAATGSGSHSSSAATPTSDGSRTPRADNASAASQTSTAVASREPSAAKSDTTTKTVDKGKSKAKVDPPKEDTKKSAKKDENFIGKLNNLATSDLKNIVGARDFLILVLYVPLMTTLCMTFLYQVLGWSAFVGFATIVGLLPVPGYVASKIRKTQTAKMKLTDARVQAVTEAVNVLRMVKLFGWEQKMTDRIQKKREEELKMLWKYKMLNLTNGLLSYFIPTVTMVITYATYTVIMKETLTASKIFSSISVFSMLREQLSRILWQMSTIIQGKVSLDRFGEFLQNTELLDTYEESAKKLGNPVPVLAVPESLEIGFRNATFMWSKEAADRSDDASTRTFKLHIDEELLFKRGCVNLIIGPTGAGKTSILMALLGEMHFIPSETDSWYNLPREGGVAYAAQESWVQNDTIRNNILFGSPYDEERYRTVIKQCALEHDLELFEAGDQTEVGERGLTLSGGQKARVTLARAVYSPAEIILLDDILAALDVHTSAWIVDQCLRGDIIKGRTVLLVTHNIALASPVAEFIVSVGLDGTVKTQGTELSLALSRDATLAAEVDEDKEVTQIGKEDIQNAAAPKPGDGKLVLAEEVVHGHITLRSWKLLFRSLGGAHPIVFFVAFMGGFALTEWSMTFQTWFLGYWGSQYEGRDPSQVDVPFYLSAYSALLALTMILYSVSYLFFTYGTIRAARTINSLLVDSIFGSTLRWLDETPTGRIISRCTQDISTVDGYLPQMVLVVFDCALGAITKLAAVVLFTPIFFFPGMTVALLGFYLGNMYLKAQLSTKRELSNARSPVLAHFSAAMHGLVSIRAYKAEDAFKAESLKRINHMIRVARTSSNLNRWIATRMEALGALFSAGLAFYLVYGPRGVGSSNTGFSLNMAVEFASSILWLVRMYNVFEVEANSLERIQGYLDIEHEPKPTESGKPPAAWPTSGDLKVEKLSARYSQTGPKVLHDVSFDIKSGERIGIVGRTGSGKSSLTLALLRCILTEGTVYYDGIPTSTINLDALRSNITIIPQTPELLSGTLRQNLDPFEQNDDATLNDALRASGLFSLQEDAGEAGINLDTKIAGGGGNLSIGQRQILALARAMIRGSKVLILDEATSAIDYKTDAVIQSTLRQQLGDDVTVITIAHRLQTIMDADKIMVLDNGRIAEFDQPKELLKKEDSALRALVEGSGDAKTLYTLAGVDPSPVLATLARLMGQAVTF